ncbi:hypothetical protein [Enterococcus casseliflavus]|uniref:hypothetical protein n=1 Tax=Enterococcus casseliflavus TaxID=37734 RepID=UPI0013301BAD|nr:hypothetical protein [Enterococcus casseliflavus]
MNKHNTMPLKEIMLAFYSIGLALKYEFKPPDNQQSSIADVAENEGNPTSSNYDLNSKLQ